MGACNAGQGALPVTPRRRRAAILAIVAIFVLLGAEPAWAWGPATHVEIATNVLHRLTLLPPAVAVLLSRHAFAYVFGAIAADVVFAKRLSRVKQFCHHWSTGFKLLEGAETEKAAAFGYGYLSHLAADTVAHGKFVPRQITLTNSTVNFGHFYWELRADALAPRQSYRQMEVLLAKDQSVHHDLMAGHLTETFLPYDLNRRLFDNMNAVLISQGSRRTMELISRCSRYDLSADLIARYRNECVDRTLSLLNDGRRSALLREDPNGSGALIQSRVARRDLRRLRRRGHPVDGYILEMTRSLDPC